MNVLEELETDVERMTCLENILIARATGETADTDSYDLLRHYFMDKPSLKPLLPDFVRTNRSLNQFWQFIKRNFKTYAERRDHIHQAFLLIFDHLEGGSQAPADHSISEALKSLDEKSVHETWNKALKRRTDDSEGAITSARSLLETVCKNILDSFVVPYSNNIDLHELYKLVAQELDLSPEQQHEDVFKKILGSCSNIVSNVGILRNRLGDAHGQGASSTRPEPRHAEFAVNLAGAMALFLVSTWKERQKIIAEVDSSSIDDLLSRKYSLRLLFPRIIKDLKSCTWPTQNPAADAVSSLGEEQVRMLSSEKQVILGRNVLQSAQGCANSSQYLLEEISVDPKKWPACFVEGIVLECFANESDQFRLKTRRLTDVIKIVEGLAPKEKNNILLSLKESLKNSVVKSDISEQDLNRACTLLEQFSSLNEISGVIQSKVAA